MGARNPYRYRGYYYDTETGFYYLQSRYYDPEVSRFINTDVVMDTGSFIGTNLFAYCLNNPRKPCGRYWILAEILYACQFIFYY